MAFTSWPLKANDNDRNDLPVFRHLEDRDENSRDRPQRDRLQEWLEEQDAPHPEAFLRAKPVESTYRAVALVLGGLGCLCLLAGGVRRKSLKS